MSEGTIRFPLRRGFGLGCVEVGLADRALRTFALLMSFTLVACAIGLADGPGWTCDGATNCAPNAPCASPGLGGTVSCTMTTPINHGKCIDTQSEGDNCTTVAKDCAKIQVYWGGTCDMGPVQNSCPTGCPGEAYTVQEDGC